MFARRVGLVSEPNKAGFMPAVAAAARHSIPRVSLHVWGCIVAYGLLAASSHAGFARGMTHDRHHHHVIVSNSSSKSHRHVVHGLHHRRTKALARTRQHPRTHHVASAIKPLIVIDPGHGGKDPGAIGASGTLEKNVTLATALDLRRMLLATGRYRVALTRGTDIYVPLNERLAFARAHAAALLISIHADASADRTAHGASVYIRSNRGSGPTALPLVTSGSMSAGTEQTLAGVIPPPLAASPWLQYTMIVNLDDDIRMTADPARQAHLYVLAAGNIPGVLLEMGFLSNRHDETLLRKVGHQRVVAAAIRDAIADYFDGLRKTDENRT